MGKGMTSRDVTLASPQWMAEPISGHLVAGGVKLDASAFGYEGTVTVTLSAAAVAGATSLSVEALGDAVPSGTVLHFGDAGEFAKLTADAASGATTLTVEAIPSALELGDAADYVPAGAVKHVKSGTVVGRTYAEMAASGAFGPAADGDDEVFLVAFDIYDVSEDNDATLLRGNVVVFENYLPEAGDLTATVLGKVREKYICKQGVE